MTTLYKRLNEELLKAFERTPGVVGIGVSSGDNFTPAVRAAFEARYKELGGVKSCPMRMKASLLVRSSICENLFTAVHRDFYQLRL